MSSAIDAILAAEMQTCVGYAVGQWSKCILLDRQRDAGGTRSAASTPYISELLADNFALEFLDCAQIFAAKRRSYVRPHCDWPGSAPLYTRIHVPLQTDERCLNSEDDIVFHMGAGEIWFVDPSRPHSGGCFSNGTRLHLVLDFDPHVPLAQLFRDSNAYQPSAMCSLVAREPFDDRHRAAIYGLSRIASDLNFSLIADILGSVHFEKQVGCAAMYDWLIEIAERSADRALVARATALKRTFLGPFGSA
ncbi:MAG: aspartyl/asparaginyl beta-hydroxylase domain-containing protein [Candidatus Eremiobacteraeota bacterium]|nr:aspartyl/asparaginyl beta-hydroxylase domain-containing protein [Candidatus Eremiobacteraeota bacterium]